jgi:hypothetical protein
MEIVHLQFKSGNLANLLVKRRSFFVALLSIALLAGFFTLMAAQPFSKAQTATDLASQYAPTLHFTSGEKFYPTTVNYVISSSTVKQRVSSGTPLLIDGSPRPDTLGSYMQSDLYLDNSLSTLDAIASDYASQMSSLGYTAYVHVASDASSTVIQYWLFYAYNNGPLNDHQGDWEVIQVFLDSSGNPSTVLLSQHGSGENAVWADVEKAQTHPVVYVAQGSHANYFRSYQGKIGIENDIVGNDGKTLAPADLNLVILSEPGSQPSSQNWLNFQGRWGYWGTEQEVLLGRAGPFGPVFNQDGTRWARPSEYLGSTFQVGGSYFILAWFVAYFLLLFLIYFSARAAWKVWGIIKMHRKGGLRFRSFLGGRGGIGLILGLVAIFFTGLALFLPWYNITASSETGALSQNGGATLMTMDGVHGVIVNTFFAGTSSDSSSGYMTLFSTQIPFAIILGVGVVLLVLDVIGVKSGKSMGKKLMLGIISTLLPVILVLIFISQLPAFMPFAYGLFPGQGIPPQVTSMIQSIAASPVQGTGTSVMPIIGSTTVTWGLGIGAFLFIVAAALRLVGGIIMYTTPELKPNSKEPQPPMQNLPPPPPQKYGY